jgi:hypothetical protein
MIKFLIAILLLGATDSIDITVVPGDTLSKISKKYLANAELWPELLKYNNIKDPNLISPGMKLKVPVKIANEELIKTAASTEKGAWVVTSVSGTAFAINGQQKQPIVKDNRIGTGTTLETARDGYVVMKLPDDSETRIGGNSKIVVEKAEFEESTGILQSYFKNLRGTLKAKVTHLMGKSNFQVAMPTAVAGVRGTEFTTEVEDDGTAKVAVIDGAVAFKSGGVEVMLPKGTGSVAKADEAPSVPAVLPESPKLGPVKVMAKGRVALAWKTPENASSCKVEVAEEPQFLSAVMAFQVPGTKEKQPNLAPGTYYWHVMCVDANGLQGPASPTTSFVVPQE